MARQSGFDTVPSDSVPGRVARKRPNDADSAPFDVRSQVGNSALTKLLHRAPATAEDTDTDKEDDDPTKIVQAKSEPEVGMAGGPVSDGLATRIDAARGGGSPLPAEVRSHMESAFDTPLDGVRLHTGSESDALNRAVTAKAFTTGNDIFVRGDAYRANSPDGNRLLAHELTHVVQQRSMANSGPMTVGAADDHLEHEADDVAASITQRMAGPADEADEKPEDMV